MPATRGAAGKCNLGHIRVGNQGFANFFPVSCNHVDHAFGEPGRLN